MTIAELNTLLATLPQHAIVLLADWNEDYAPPHLLQPNEIHVCVEGTKAAVVLGVINYEKAKP